MPVLTGTKAPFIAAAGLLSVLCALSPARAGNQSAQQAACTCYAITFLSLKPGHHIGPARLCLSDNGTLELAISDETISAQKGAFSIDGLLLTAATEFSAGQVRRRRYTLAFRGIALLNTYIAGAAQLREYIDANRFIQEVPFLFAGSTKREDSRQDDSLLPF